MEELGLEVDKKKYMIGLISRLTDQKGLDLINAVMDGLVDEFTQLVVIGTGEPQYENMFRHYAWKYPNRVSANICYSYNRDGSIPERNHLCQTTRLKAGSR